MTRTGQTVPFRKKKYKIDDAKLVRRIAWVVHAGVLGARIKQSEIAKALVETEVIHSHSLEPLQSAARSVTSSKL